MTVVNRWPPSNIFVNTCNRVRLIALNILCQRAYFARMARFRRFCSGVVPYLLATRRTLASLLEQHQGTVQLL